MHQCPWPCCCLAQVISCHTALRLPVVCTNRPSRWILVAAAAAAPSSKTRLNQPGPLLTLPQLAPTRHRHRCDGERWKIRGARATNKLEESTAALARDHLHRHSEWTARANRRGHTRWNPSLVRVLVALLGWTRLLQLVVSSILSNSLKFLNYLFACRRHPEPPLLCNSVHAIASFPPVSCLSVPLLAL